jgi:hypothetical protein
MRFSTLAIAFPIASDLTLGPFQGLNGTQLLSNRDEMKWSEMSEREEEKQSMEAIGMH